MANPTNPFGDVAKMMEQFKVPGIDMTAIVEAQRKEIEALTEANQAAFQSMQAIAAKQNAMMTEAMQGMQAAVQGVMGGGMPDPAKQTEIMQKGIAKTLSDMKELAEMAQQAQADAMTRITQRAAEQMQGFGQLTQKK